MDMEVRAASPKSNSRHPLRVFITVLLTGLVSTGCVHRGHVAPLPTAICSTQPTEVTVGEPVTATVASNFNPKHGVMYNWTVTNGRVAGNGNTVAIDTNGLAGGSYTATVHVIDPQLKKNRDASCSASFEVKEPLKNPPAMSCSVNPGLLEPGETATITCNCTSPDGVPMTVGNWSASAGTISGSGNSAELDTRGTGPGPLTVSATCTDARGLTVSSYAQLQIVVPAAPPPPPPILETGRDFLLPGDTEKAGYGLYSYLLWWDNPSQEDKDRFINVVSAFLRMPKIAAVEGTEKVQSSTGTMTASVESIPKTNLNLAYLPVSIRPPEGVSAKWIVDHYDVVRARMLLRKLPRKYESGPYIVSTVRPLGAGLSATDHYLFQNLSAPVITPELADAWIRNFQDMATDKEFWKPPVMRDFALNLRSMVAELAQDIPSARKGVATWIGWLSPPKPETATH